MRKYKEIFKYAFKVNTTYIFDYFFSTLSYTFHMIVFGMLWDYILKDGSAFGYNRTELILYILISEFITYGISSYYKQISNMVKDGTIANMLLRPMNLVTYFFVEQTANIPKIAINLIAGIIMSFTLTNGMVSTLTISASAFWLFIISCVLAFIIGMLLQIIIGLIAFFMEEVRSIYFIVQKFQLLLVFVPLEFYGTVIQKILLLMPTTYMVYAPARILVKFNMIEAINLIGIQFITVTILIGTALLLFKKGVEKINVNGG